jgi:hypothetical protein
MAMNPELPRRVPVCRGHMRPLASQLRDGQTPRMALFPRGPGLQDTEGERD